MEEVIWSRVPYTEKEIAGGLGPGAGFPLLLCTTEACKGPAGIQFAFKQVLRIHGLKQQQRVLCIDALGRHITIPLDFETKLEVLDPLGRAAVSEPKQLNKILRGNQLPLKVRFITDEIGYDCVDKTSASIGCMAQLEIQYIFNDYYLLVNLINDGWIENDIYIVPSFVELVGVIGEGLRNQTPAIWTEWQAMYTRTVNRVPFDSTPGCSEIAIYAHAFRPDDSAICRAPENSPFGTLERKQEVDGNGGVSRRQIIPPFSSLDRATDWYKSEDKKLTHMDNLRSRTLTHEENNNISPAQFVHVTKVTVDNSIATPPPTLPPKMRPSKKEPVQFQLQNPPFSRRSHAEHSTMEAATSPMTPPADETKPELPPREPIISEDAHSGNKWTAKVKPRVRTKGSTKVMADAQAQTTFSKGTGQQVEFTTLKDVPVDIAQLTVEQVVQCLEMLNLRDQIGTFRRNQIDGALLSGLDENILRQDFDCSFFNAKKIVRFAKEGWRPKLMP